MEILVAVILAAHLLCVDIASAGPLVCIWLDWRGRRDATARDAGRWLAKTSLAGLIVGGLLVVHVSLGDLREGNGEWGMAR